MTHHYTREIDGAEFKFKQVGEYALWEVWKGSYRLPGSFTSIGKAQSAAEVHQKNKAPKKKVAKSEDA